MKSSAPERLKYRPTLKDIAARTGVSLSAVSQALNDKGALTEELRRRIKDAAIAMGYSPNPAARILRGVRSNAVGIIINYYNNPFFRNFLLGLEKVTDAEGMIYSVAQTRDDLAKEQRLVRAMAENGVDGLIVLNCSDAYAHLSAVSESFSIPIVLISHFLEDRFAAIQADNLRGGRLAAEHLLSLDERPLFHLEGYWGKSGLLNRKRGFVQAVSEVRPGFVAEEACFPVEGLTAAAGYQAMTRIHGRHKPPFGLFVVNDEVALGVMTYCRHHSLRWPEDVAVVGFSDIDILETLDIPLTSIRIPQQRMGEEAARTLLDLIAYPEKRLCPPVLTLPVSLVVRESTVARAEEVRDWWG